MIMMILLLLLLLLRREREKKTGIQPKEKSLKQINPMPFKLTW